MPRNSAFDLAYRSVATAALDQKPVSGMTHTFYRYPARFSPSFAASAIENFSKESDIVLDPYMGGGTTIVESLAQGRKTIGNDLNSLAVFITRVKTMPLTKQEQAAAREWSHTTLSQLSYRMELDPSRCIEPQTGQTKNLNVPKARFIKKLVALALESCTGLHSDNLQAFARCVILRTAQWALDGREAHTTVQQFKDRLALTAEEMVTSVESFRSAISKHPEHGPILLNVDTALLPSTTPFQLGLRADLVVTSPPYPGVHVLYHRWQVDGRKETPAPYWIAGCQDGMGASYYNFADRRAMNPYFEKSLATLQGIRAVMRRGGVIVQLVAFNCVETQLSRYLNNMEHAPLDRLFAAAETGTQDRADTGWIRDSGGRRCEA